VQCRWGCLVNSATMINMTDSYYKTLLLEGRAKKLQELVALASKDRPAIEAKRFKEEAQRILRDLAELDDKILVESDGPGGLDYREDVGINVSIVRYLTNRGGPATEAEITSDLIRGQFPGYKDAHRLAIRVGRCVRSYTVGRPSENPKLKVRKNLVGLIEWPDKMFS
jgi:hypothetical protein